MRSLTLTLVLALAVGMAAPAGAAEPDTVGLLDPATGTWLLRNQEGHTATFFYGIPGDVPLMGDWDCDGVDTVGMFRPSNGFAYLRNQNRQGVADLEFFYGIGGDVPLVGDWDGDGCDTLAIYRNGEVFVRNRLGTGIADFSFFFGIPGDRPFAGDFDGDGRTTVGLYRESTGFAYFRDSLSSGFADFEFFYGAPGDRIIAGDWTDQGRETVGIFRPAESTFYLRNSNSQGPADEQFGYGSASMLPVAGNFGDIEALPDLSLELVTAGLSSPTFATAPAGDSRLFVTELDGRILIVEDGVVRPQPFVDIDNLVGSGGEQGLLGLAFHPNYAANGRFFVNYTDNAGDTRVAELKVSADPNVADPASLRNLMTIAQPYGNHNAGMIEFGPDGYLYIATGDGGSGHDPDENGENPFTLLGGILRIDVDGAQPYAVPSGNPFVGGGGAPEVWAYGLRNPWRFAIDDGHIYIGDVGQSSWEEIDVVPLTAGGANFGWDILEGSDCHEPSSGCSSAGTVLPVLEYPSTGASCSVIGGFVYRGAALPQLQGHYFYGDLCGGWIRSFRHVNGAAVDQRDWSDLAVSGSIWSFGKDGFGELYVLTGSGFLYRLVPGV